MGPEAVATKPIGDMKYMDWKKVQQIVNEHPDSVIYAGLMEDWNNTGRLIFAKGEYYNGNVYGSSVWATPIVDVDGEEIECWTYEKTEEGHSKPSWWGNGAELKDVWDFDEDRKEKIMGNEYKDVVNGDIYLNPYFGDLWIVDDRHFIKINDGYCIDLNDPIGFIKVGHVDNVNNKFGGD